MEKFKAGDLVTIRYKQGDEWKKGIGYCYDAGHSLYVGISCADGGCKNEPIEDLRSVQLVEVKPKW